MAANRRGTFAFDLSKPVKKGTLLKQGSFHRAFKSREFVLYPGFLVYYDSENKWRLDLTKGETLGGRLGAVKLKGSTVSIARDAPKGCKYGIALQAPDPANKRQAYLMNASSKEDRDNWIEAIRKSSPTSPHMPRKDMPAAADKPKPAERKSVERTGSPSQVTQSPPPPAYTMRQDTACDAAVALASCTDTREEQKAVEEMISSVNSSLRETDCPSRLSRLNTATMAAISLEVDDEPDNEEAEPETSIDLMLGERESEDDSSSYLSTTPEVCSPDLNSSSPDQTLAPEAGDSVQNPSSLEAQNSAQNPSSLEAGDSVQNPSSLEAQNSAQNPSNLEAGDSVQNPSSLEAQNSAQNPSSVDAGDSVQNPSSQEADDSVLKRSSEKQLSTDPMTPNTMSPEPEDATLMETNEMVRENSVDWEGGPSVTTVVTVACSSQNSSPMLDRREDGREEDKREEEGREEDVALVNGTPEGEEGADSLHNMVEEEKRGHSTSSTQILLIDNEHTTLSVNLSNYDSDNTLSDEESHAELPEEDLLENGEKNGEKGEMNGEKGEMKGDKNGEKGEEKGENKWALEKSPSGSPPKSPLIAIKEDRTGSRSSSDSSEDSKLSTPTDKRRKTSTPFVEKKGFLYKMGGQRKTWKLRYFVLRPGVFNYFKDNRTTKPIGEVKLKNLNVFFPGMGERKQSFQFTVHTESSWNKRSDYVFAGQSEREMKEWITAFKLAGMKAGAPADES